MCGRRWVDWREGEGGNEYLRIHRPRDFRRLFRLLRIYRRLNVGCTRFVHRCVSSHLKKGKVIIMIIKIPNLLYCLRARYPLT